MTEENIRRNVEKHFGKVDFELIEFSKYNQPVTYKCLHCGKVFTLKRLDSLYNSRRARFCRCLPYPINSPMLISLKDAQKRLDTLYPNEFLILEKDYQGWTKKALVKHLKCGKIFKIKPKDLLESGHCPCTKILSKGEERISAILNKYNILYETQKRLEGIKKAPFDFYLPDYSLLIEFQGRQHYEPVEQFGGEKQLIKQKEIDRRKKQIALEQGYDILYINYKQMSNIEQLLVQRLSVTGVGLSGPKSQSPRNED